MCYNPGTALLTFSKFLTYFVIDIFTQDCLNYNVITHTPPEIILVSQMVQISTRLLTKNSSIQVEDLNTSSPALDFP